MKQEYKEGTWFAVPLRAGGFGAGLVARAVAGKPVIPSLSMKTDAHILLLLLFLVTAPHARADGEPPSSQPNAGRTNVFSLTQSDIKDETGEEQAYYANCLTHHVTMPETLPSNLDTNGNWGPETNGLQLSLRFHDKNYTLGDQVPAIIILRNLEQTSRSLLLANSSSLWITVLLCYDSSTYSPERENFILKRRHYYLPISSPPHGLSSQKFSQMSEKMVVLDLNRLFDLKQTRNYTASAICRVYSPVTKSVLYELESGTASFSLVKATNSASGVH
jgi:hypothetical protein